MFECYIVKICLHLAFFSPLYSTVSVIVNDQGLVDYKWVKCIPMVLLTSEKIIDAAIRKGCLAESLFLVALQNTLHMTNHCCKLYWPITHADILQQSSFSIILLSNSMNSLNWVYSDVSLK